MPHECGKEGQLSALEVATKNIEDGLKEQREILKKFVDVLQDISAQNQQIIDLRSADSRHEKNFNNIFPRINTLEINAGKETVRVGFIMAGMATASSALTAILVRLFK
jgi:hypothetical protein